MTYCFCDLFVCSCFAFWDGFYECVDAFFHGLAMVVYRTRCMRVNFCNSVGVRMVAVLDSSSMMKDVV